jgi:phytanoyl-CoA hydroxylase
VDGLVDAYDTDTYAGVGLPTIVGAPTLENIADYRRVGALVVRGLFDESELRHLRRAASTVVRAASRGRWPDDTTLSDDTKWSEHGAAEGLVSRVEHVLAKSPTFRRALAKPQLLALVEALVGPSFVPTWDSLVVKVPEAGARSALPWHRDAGLYRDSVAACGNGRVIDVGIYLDASAPESCVWVTPGTNYLDNGAADILQDELNRQGPGHAGLPAVLEAGDVLVHNILVVHSATSAPGFRRRVVYFEFRPAELEWQRGPHTPDYLTLKQDILLACIDERRRRHSRSERAFRYEPPALMNFTSGAPPESWRVSHTCNWRWPGIDDPGI